MNYLGKAKKALSIDCLGSKLDFKVKERMGIVIFIKVSYKWERTYFVQSMDEHEAKEKAYKMFKQTMTCMLPDTLEEAEADEGFFMEVLAVVEQIII